MTNFVTLTGMTDAELMAAYREGYDAGQAEAVGPEGLDNVNEAIESEGWEHIGTIGEADRTITLARTPSGRLMGVASDPGGIGAVDLCSI